MAEVILSLTALWHLLAFWHFTLFPRRTLALTTRERPVSEVAAELLRFLGGLNLAPVVLALASLAVTPGQRWTAFLALAVANLSQLLVDLRVRRLGLARGAFFTQILVGDAFFTAANTAALALC
jgi:hypothetical protein